MMTAYYNEFDPRVAAWLRQLILNGDITDGEVDERSITDVTASDLRGFTQHHFFAGIGTWSYALRNAGWSDDRPVCTASLPCQPFSVAGNQEGKDDERHLLPHFIELVKQYGFNTIFGEQVESAIRHGWLDDLQTNMEREGYAVGHCVLGAHSVNAAHIRQRLYWVADGRRPNAKNRNGRSEPQFTSSIGGQAWNELGGNGSDSGVDDSDGMRQQGKRWEGEKGVAKYSKNSGVGNAQSGRQGGVDMQGEGSQMAAGGHGNGESVEWFYCRDNKYRPIKSGIKPLVDGVARGMVYSGGKIDANDTGLARVVRLKGYGNAICEPTARLFIQSWMEVMQ